MAKEQIRFDQWMAELEAAHREAPAVGKIRFTEEQDRALLAARDDIGMSWPPLVKWWRNRFGWGSDDTLRIRYRELKGRVA